NALRTIDTWYPQPENSEERVGAIAIEIYGSVTNLGKAYRNPKDKADFYTLFDRFVRHDENLSIEQKHYIMAVLVRGGVFGESSKD
ncbi:partial CRISPR-associated protein Csy3, partial [uncultured bacterium]